MSRLAWVVLVVWCGITLWAFLASGWVAGLVMLALLPFVEIGGMRRVQSAGKRLRNPDSAAK